MLFSPLAGRIKAIQLEYSEARRTMTNALRKAPQHTAVGFKQTVSGHGERSECSAPPQARGLCSPGARAGPLGDSGLSLVLLQVHKLLIVVELLLGEIPDRLQFRQPSLKRSLMPYFLLTQGTTLLLCCFSTVCPNLGEREASGAPHPLVGASCGLPRASLMPRSGFGGLLLPLVRGEDGISPAWCSPWCPSPRCCSPLPLLCFLPSAPAVRTGNLAKFNQVLDQFGDKFQADGTYTLIIRLRHNVIKTGKGVPGPAGGCHRRRVVLHCLPPPQVCA